MVFNEAVPARLREKGSNRRPEREKCGGSAQGAAPEVWELGKEGCGGERGESPEHRNS